MKLIEFILIALTTIGVLIGLSGEESTLDIAMLILSTVSFVYLFITILVTDFKRHHFIWHIGLFKKIPKIESPLLRILGFLLGASTSVLLAGILFYLLKWEGYQMMIGGGSVALIIATTGLVLIKTKFSAEIFYLVLVHSLFYLGLTAVLLFGQ